MTLTTEQVWALIFMGWCYGLLSALLVLALLFRWGWIKAGKGR